MGTINEAIEQFIAYIEGTQAPRTAKAYQTGLGHFARYLKSQSLPPTMTDVEELRLPVAIDFLAWLRDYLLHEVAGGQPEKVSEATRAAYLAAFSRFIEYLVVEAQILPWTFQDYDALRKALTRATRRNQSRTELPADKLPRQRIVDALLAEARRPLALPEEMPEGERQRQMLAWLRNIAMIEALVSSGMRVGELVRLERGHLLYEEHGAVVKYAKRGKEREVLFSARAWDAIQAYLRARQDGAQLRPLADLPVFARHDRGAGSKVLPLTTRSVQRIFLKLASQAGVLEEFHLTPHTLRHFFATEFLSETGDLALTQYALGHASPTTTRIYAQTKRKDYRQAHERVFGSK